jgi:hypothetical protein
MANTSHEAAASAIGYLYQTQWPLVELIRRSREQPDVELRLELLDDVEWLEGGQPRELAQIKHHIRRTAGLGDMSVDLWRTVSVWLDASRLGDLAGPAMTIVTTAVATDGTAAWALLPASRDVVAAQYRLETAARDSENAITAEGRTRFLALSPEERAAFVSRMRVVDGAPHIQDLDAELRKELHLAVPRGHESAFIGLVWDWWLRQALALLRRDIPTVSGLHVAAAIDDLRDQFGDDNLPTLVPREAFDQSTLGDYDARTFVRQLTFVDTPPLILQRSVQDYYRATVQSAQWIENNLVDLPEVSKFKEDLRDEWERSFAWSLSTLPTDPSEEDKRRLGRELLERCLDTTGIQIRPRYREPFYFRGKLHELADERLVGWHPDFESLLDALLESAT